MSDLNPLFPRQKTPELNVPLVGGGEFDLAASSPPFFTMLVFYRGLHCPICKSQLRELNAKLPEFEKRGVEVIAVSTDPIDRATKSKAEWELGELRVGFALDPHDARRWGLYMSSARQGTEEPAFFNEPAIYLIRPDQTLYFGSVQTMPFARPHFSDILTAIDYVVSKDYPARGEVAELS